MIIFCVAFVAMIVGVWFGCRLTLLKFIERSNEFYLGVIYGGLPSEEYTRGADDLNDHLFNQKPKDQ